MVPIKLNWKDSEGLIIYEKGGDWILMNYNISYTKILFITFPILLTMTRHNK